MPQKHLSRRDLLKRGALGAAAITVTPILSDGLLGPRRLWASPGGGGTPGKFIVLVNLIGGNDCVNMVVPHAAPSYASRRPTINLVDNLPDPMTEPLLAINGNHSFHYKMPGIHQMWNDGDVHIVGKVSYPSPNQSHFTSRDIYSFGVRDYEFMGDGRGWLGRFADCYWSTPSNPLGIISVGLSKQPDFRASVTNPVVLGDVPGFDISIDGDFPEDHMLRDETVRGILNNEPLPENDPARLIFSTNRDTYPLVDSVQNDTAGWADPGGYPNNTFGRYMKTVSQLVHARAAWGTQVYYTGLGGFDTHSGQHSGTGGQNRHGSLMQNLDEALTAFAGDMKAKGLWDDVVICCFSEFGRRCFENGSNGTDHGWGSTNLFLGGAVKGQMAGPGYTAELTEADLQLDYVPYGVDFRDLYGNVVQNHLGLDPAPLFPDAAYVPNLMAADLT